jgi:hypothetical protein
MVSLVSYFQHVPSIREEKDLMYLNVSGENRPRLTRTRRNFQHAAMDRVASAQDPLPIWR